MASGASGDFVMVETEQLLPDPPSDPRLNDSDNDSFVEARESDGSVGSDFERVELPSPNVTVFPEVKSITIIGHDEVAVAKYNGIANKYCDDIVFGNFILTSSLEKVYSRRLENKIDDETVIGFVSVLTGRLNQILTGLMPNNDLYSKEVESVFHNFDNLLNINLSKHGVSRAVEKYAQGRFYQAIGDLLSCRISLSTFPRDDMQTARGCIAVAYSLAILNLECVSLDSDLSNAFITVSRCEMHLALEYGLQFGGVAALTQELFETKKYSHEIFQKLFANNYENIAFDQTFLAKNIVDVDFVTFTNVPFNCDEFLTVHAKQIWLLNQVPNFLDHFLFILGYAKPVSYDFISDFFPALKNGPVSLLTLSKAEVFLILISISFYYTNISCYNYGYDEIYRNLCDLPSIGKHSDLYENVFHATILPVVRHSRPGPVRNLIWKAICIVGQSSDAVPVSEIFQSRALLDELIVKIKCELYVTELYHNGYVVSERFHLMLQWYHNTPQLSSESKRLLNVHLQYLKRRVDFNPPREAIRSASKTGDILTQTFPSLNLEWLIYPNGPSCSCKHLASVYDIIHYFNLQTYERGSKLYNDTFAMLSIPFQDYLRDAEYKANTVVGKPFSEKVLFLSKALEHESDALKKELDFELPTNLSWERIRNLAQTTSHKIDNSKVSHDFFSLSSEMQKLSLEYRTEAIRLDKTKPAPESDLLPGQVELQKTFNSLKNELQKQGDLLSKTIESINNFEKEKTLMEVATISSNDFPLIDFCNFANYCENPQTSSFNPAPMLETLNVALEAVKKGSVAEKEVLYKDILMYLSTRTQARNICSSLDLSQGDMYRLSLSVAALDGILTENLQLKIMSYIDDVYGVTTLFKPPLDFKVSSIKTDLNNDSIVNNDGDDETTKIGTFVTSSPTAKPSVSATNTTATFVNSSGNDIFKKAFQQWRGISEDTPEDVVANVLAPSLTRSSLARYNPTIQSASRNEQVEAMKKHDYELDDSFEGFLEVIEEEEYSRDPNYSDVEDDDLFVIDDVGSDDNV